MIWKHVPKWTGAGQAEAGQAHGDLFESKAIEELELGAELGYGLVS